MRDYVHVNDLAAAHLLALGLPFSPDRPFLAINLGAGRGYSVREIVEAVTEVVGQAPPVTEGSRRTGDPAMLVADISRARDVLGWRPQASSLKTIIETAVAWRRSPAFGFPVAETLRPRRIEVIATTPMGINEDDAAPDLYGGAVG